MDAVGSERAVLFGISEGGPMSILFAATYPERTLALILAGAYARKAWAPDYPWGARPEEIQKFLDESQQKWGGPVGMAQRAPSLLHDKHFMDWWATYLRLGASPGAVAALWRMNAEIDVRHALSVICVPTLVIQRSGDLAVRAENSRYLADHIHGAKYVELPGNDHLPYAGDAEAILNEVQEFVTGVRPVVETNRMLATVLFTDIVASTARAAEMGDRRWRELLEDYHAVVRRELIRYRGHEIETAGDGVLATFDGPTRAIRCAASICEAVKPLGVQIRAGLHTGEVETMGEKVGGIAVHIAARVVGKAGPDEVVVSSTVKDLVAGSGIPFADHGVHTMKGIPGKWRLYSVVHEVTQPIL
jgi:class 3 adenylate cyclase